MQKPNEIIESHPATLYVVLAKAALWLSSLTLTGVVVGGIYSVLHGNMHVVSNMVQACQVLTIISVTVLGWHGYTGHRVLHELRHFNDTSDDSTVSSDESPTS